ncbi:MAG: gluconokinase [Candidatus Humimicrobiaceae bacterium]
MTKQTMQMFMGVDLGTSSLKAGIFDSDGEEIGFSSVETSIICSSPGMAELNPKIIFQTFLDVVKQCIKKSKISADNIEAIGLSTQMHSVIAIDSQGNCISNAIIWADTRAKNQAESLKEKFDYKKMSFNTGCRIIHPAYPLSKILWLRENEPDLYKKIYKFITIKEYVLLRLFGDFFIDYSDASSTGCFNIHSFKWDDYIMENVLSIKPNKFGEPVECTHALKNMKKEYADYMGLKNKTVFIIGSTDGVLANFGSGVFDDNSVSCTIGTSGAIRVTSNKPIIDPLQRIWCYCFGKGIWVAGGAINNGGLVLKWLGNLCEKQYEHEIKLFNTKNIFKLFDHYASQVRPGSNGLISLPFLTGERSPNWNANAVGIIYGLTLMHEKKHIIRSAMEGVIYNIFSVYKVMSQLNKNIKKIKASGGYSRSDIWLQIQADVFNKNIETLNINDTAVLGASYVAMLAIGAIDSFENGLSVMKPYKIIKPTEKNVEIYEKAYKKFEEINSLLN